MLTEPINVTDEAFEKQVLQNELPVVVDFWAEWCGPCKMVAPTLDKLAEEFAGQVVVAKVDTDQYQPYMMQYGIRGIPTMLFFMDGQLVHRQTGALPEPMLRNVFEQFLKAVDQYKEEQAEQAA